MRAFLLAALLAIGVALPAQAQPVHIGDYCFVGTACTVLGGAVLPDYCVLGANSLLNKAYDKTHQLYGGVPAKPIESLDPALAYFTRARGFVV